MNMLHDMLCLSIAAAGVSGGYGLGHRTISSVVNIPSSIAPTPPTWGETIAWSILSGVLTGGMNKIYKEVKGEEPDGGDKLTHLGAACVISSTAIEAIIKQTPSQEIARGFGPIFIVACAYKIYKEIQEHCQTGRLVK